VVYHVVVGPDDGDPLRHLLHARWVEGAIKPWRGLHRPVKRVIGQQEGRRHLRVALFGVLDCPGRQRIESPILSNNEVLHAVFRDMAIYCIDKRRKQPLRGIPVSNEEA
jgi:hypothetical protein